MRFGLSIIFTIVLFLPMTASAQSLEGLGGAGAEAFSVSVSPQYPAPYSQATVSLLSSLLELTNSTMVASVNGREVYKGAVRPFSVTLNRAGSIANVKVTVSSGGTNYSRSISIQPQDVVLIVEPLSSAPPLYPGKPLVPLGGSARVVAMANLKDAGGGFSSQTGYSYEWTVDRVRIANSSGIGKSAIVVASPLQYRVREVFVAVTNSSGSLVGGTTVSLTAMEPSVRVYESDPLLGIRYDRALSDSYSISGTEATLYAAPFSLPTTNGSPFIQWFLNGAAAQTGNSITMRPTGSGKGDASLSLVASTGGPATATANFSVSFGTKSGTNLFGL